jgi:phosphoribosylanthranilate isomerase
VGRQLHVFIVSVRGALLIGCLILIGCSSTEERFAEKIEQANVNLKKGAVQRAIKILEELKDEFPDEPQLFENLAFAFIQSEDYFIGAFYFNELAQRFPQKKDYYLYSAQAWVKAGDLESAIKNYEAYLLDNKTDWNTWQQIGDRYLETNQTSKAIHAYSNSSQIRFNPKLELKAALLANESGNLRQAEAGFERLLVVEDTAVAQQAHIGLIQIKHKRRQWDEVAKLMSAVEKNFPQALNSPELNDVNADFEQFKEAKEKEEDAIQKQEDERQRLVEQQRQRAEALAAARLAASKPAEPKEPETEVAPSKLALTDEEDENQSADESSASLIEIKGNQSPFNNALFSARQIAPTNLEAAVAKYWDAINLGDESGVAFYELARVYYNRNQFTEAEMTSLEALRRGPKNNRYLMTYLTVIRKTKAKPDVVAEIRKYRQLYPKNSDLILLLARTYAEPGGDPNAARGLYDLFFEIAPTHPETDRARYEVRGI